ncbi:amidohydrolase family protein [bacterium]|nr:amidohydrolase family protein [bacterium]
MKKIAFLFLMTFSVLACSEKDAESFAAISVRDTTGTIIFHDVHIVNVEQGTLEGPVDVITDSQKISAIGPNLEIPSGAIVLDCSGKYLMPGLADMHTHVNYENDLLPYVANGVTTILNMGSPSNILSMRDQVKSGDLLGPTIYAGAFVDGTGSRGWIVQTEEAARTVVGTIQSQGWDFIKVYNSIQTDVFLALMDEAKSKNMPVIGHGVRAPGLKRIIQEGQAMIAHAEEYIYAYFNFSNNESKIPEAVSDTKNAGAYLTTTLSAYRIIMKQWGNSSGRDALLSADEIKYVDPRWVTSWRNSGAYIHNQGNLNDNYHFQQQFVKAFNDAGIPLLAGTDSPTIPGGIPGFMIHDDLAELKKCGISNADVLKIATLNAGNFIIKTKPEEIPFGKIQLGYRADLLLLNQNPLTDLTHLKNRAGVMVRGHWLSEEELSQKMETLASEF